MQLFADEHAALAVILYLLPVEAVVKIFMVVIPERDGCRYGKRYTLVCGPDQRFTLYLVINYALGIVFAEAGELRTRFVVARIYKIRRLAAAF